VLNEEQIEVTQLPHSGSDVWCYNEYAWERQEK